MLFVKPNVVVHYLANKMMMMIMMMITTPLWKCGDRQGQKPEGIIYKRKKVFKRLLNRSPYRRIY